MRVLSEAIEQVCRVGFYYSLTAGLIQLSYRQDPAVLAEGILDRYYNKDRRSAAQSDEQAVV